MPDYSLADIAAATGNGGNNGNNNGFGNNDGILWLLLFILIGGFGNNRGWGNGGGYGAGNVGGNELYPWLNNAENVNGGFRDQMMQTTLQGIQTQGQNLATQLCNCCGDMQMALANGFAGVNLGMANGFAGVQQSLCNGFNGTNVALLEGFNGVEQGANARQMANMQTQFGLQTAMQQGFNAAQQQTAQFAYDTGLGMAQQTATILAEHCSDRAALSDGVRDIIASGQAGTQAIIDKLCQLELDGYKRQVEDKNDRILDLQQQLNSANFAASQQAQNALIAQGFANEVDQLYNRLSNCPVPSTPVYGRTPIFTCNNGGCGCMGN